MTRIALDTNILVYSEGLARSASDGPKIDLSRRLLRGLLLAGERPGLPVPCLSELHNVLVRKGRLSAPEASERAAKLRAVADVYPVTPDDLDAALELSAHHGLQIFDAVILAVAVEGNCDLLVSEDLQDGFAWRGLLVSNPFGANPDPRLARLLSSES